MSDAPRWPAIAFVVIVVELLGWNLHVFVRNQKEFDPGDKPRLGSRSLVRVAEQNDFGTVRYGFAFYHRMRALDGATLVLPPALKGHEFHLERVSRLHIEYAPGDVEISPEAVKRLDRYVTRHAAVDAGTPILIMRRPGERRYVMAWISGEPRWVVMPESLYRGEAQGASRLTP